VYVFEFAPVLVCVFSYDVCVDFLVDLCMCVCCMAVIICLCYNMCIGVNYFMAVLGFVCLQYVCMRVVFLSFRLQF